LENHLNKNGSNRENYLIYVISKSNNSPEMVPNMPLKGFKCKQCGNCCLNLIDAFQTSATDQDIQTWEDEGRDDILDWVDPIHFGDDECIYDIWISPITHDDVKRCPWLRKLPKQDKYICRIHDVKPEHCRAYPRSRKHAMKTGCKGI
jgi:Fe-S-cluster containining protein